MKKPFLLITIILCISCVNQNKQTINKDEREFYTINFDDCLKNNLSINISEIADTVKYLKLNTPSDVIITSIRRIVYAEPYIFLTSRGIAYQFSSNGNFVRQIGKKGKGPGEYIGVENILVDSIKKEIILCTFFNFLYYNYNGEFVRSKKIIAQASAILDSTIWIANPSHGYEKLKLFGISKNMDTIAYLKNFDLWKSKNSGYFSVVSKNLSPFYDYNSKLYFKGYEDSDTIWEISGTSINLHACIDMGKYRLPLEYRPDYSIDNFNEYSKNYYRVPAVTEDNKFLYLVSGTWDKLPEVYIMFDKLTHKGFVVKNNKLSGITDDIHHGASFWPLFISDKYYISVVEAEDLLNGIDNKIVSQSLKHLISTINENTNQLLILAKKKAGK